MNGLSGGAGWIGAGLLGAVLSWLLLKHLPDKDRQIKELMDCHRTTEKDQRCTYTLALEALTDDFKSELATERDKCDQRISELRSKLEDLAEFMRTRAESMAKRKGIIE